MNWWIHVCKVSSDNYFFVVNHKKLKEDYQVELRPNDDVGFSTIEQAQADLGSLTKIPGDTNWYIQRVSTVLPAARYYFIHHNPEVVDKCPVARPGYGSLKDIKDHQCLSTIHNTNTKPITCCSWECKVRAETAAAASSDLEEADAEDEVKALNWWVHKCVAGGKTTLIVNHKKTAELNEVARWPQNDVGFSSVELAEALIGGLTVTDDSNWFIQRIGGTTAFRTYQIHHNDAVADKCPTSPPGYPTLADLAGRWCLSTIHNTNTNPITCCASACDPEQRA